MTGKIFGMIVLLIVLVLPFTATAKMWRAGAVDVRVVSDRGYEYKTYRTYPQTYSGGRYYYLEAVKGDRYSIKVANRSGRRIGVVIAVDGRNIVSGQKSDLKPDERMYILEPYESYTYEGWRTGMDRTNRFYFTEQSDSYAERAFSDGSAMGTIAVAVYRERIPETTIRHDKRTLLKKEGPVGAFPHDAGDDERRGASENMKTKTSDQAGTGFGETTYSPARTVFFTAEKKVFERVVLKYEWRSELCKKGIASCGTKNRLWPNNSGFAPIPDDTDG